MYPRIIISNIFQVLYIAMQQSDQLQLLRRLNPKRVFDLLTVDEIIKYFQSFDHQEGFKLIDPQMLQMVYQKTKQHKLIDSSSQFQKIDVLTEGVQQLLRFCENKQLVSLSDQILTTNNRAHRSHSYYGNLLVNNFPEEFFIGPKCTHYHRKTTAKNIEAQYGIYRPQSDQQQSGDNYYVRQSDEQFINDVEQQSSQPTSKRKSKRKLKQEKKASKKQQKSSEFKIKNRKRGMFLDSDSQDLQEQIQKKCEESEQITMKRNKFKNSNAQNFENKRLLSDEQIFKIIQENQVEAVLDIFQYKQIFQYLLQFHPHKFIQFMANSDPTQLLQIIHQNQAKSSRQKQQLKTQANNYKLNKSKINIKTLNLQQVLAECVKQGIIQEEDQLKWEIVNPIQNHVLYGYKLLSKNPKKYCMEGFFIGYETEELNNKMEQLYKNRARQAQMEEDEEEEQDQDDFLDQSQSEIQSEVMDELDVLEKKLKQIQ